MPSAPRTVQPAVAVAGVVDAGVVGDHRDHRQVVPLARLVVVVVVGRRDLDRARAELADRTTSSAMIGTSRSTNGMSTLRPTIAVYRSSSGWTATAVSPRIVSGRVVATVIVSSGSAAPVARR